MGIPTKQLELLLGAMAGESKQAEPSKAPQQPQAQPAPQVPQQEIVPQQPAQAPTESQKTLIPGEVIEIPADFMGMQGEASQAVVPDDINAMSDQDMIALLILKYPDFQKQVSPFMEAADMAPDLDDDGDLTEQKDKLIDQRDQLEADSLAVRANPIMADERGPDYIEVALRATSDALAAYAGNYGKRSAFGTVRKGQERQRQGRETNLRRLRLAEETLRTFKQRATQRELDKVERKIKERKDLDQTLANVTAHPALQMTDELDPHSGLAVDQRMLKMKAATAVNELVVDPDDPGARARLFAVRNELDQAYKLQTENKDERTVLLDSANDARQLIGKIGSEKVRDSWLKALQQAMQLKDRDYDEKRAVVAQLTGEVEGILEEQRLIRQGLARKTSDPRIRNLERMMDNIAGKGGDLTPLLEQFPFLREIEQGTAQLQDVDPKEFDAARKKLREVQAEQNSMDKDDLMFHEQNRDALLSKLDQIEAEFESLAKQAIGGGITNPEKFKASIVSNLRSRMKKAGLSGMFREAIEHRINKMFDEEAARRFMDLVWLTESEAAERRDRKAFAKKVSKAVTTGDVTPTSRTHVPVEETNLEKWMRIHRGDK